MNLTQMTIISTTMGKNPLEEIRVAITVNKRVLNAPTSNAEEAEFEWFYEEIPVEMVLSNNLVPGLFLLCMHFPDFPILIWVTEYVISVQFSCSVMSDSL